MFTLTCTYLIYEKSHPKTRASFPEHIRKMNPKLIYFIRQKRKYRRPNRPDFFDCWNREDMDYVDMSAHFLESFSWIPGVGVLPSLLLIPTGLVRASKGLLASPAMAVAGGCRKLHENIHGLDSEVSDKLLRNSEIQAMQVGAGLGDSAYGVANTLSLGMLGLWVQFALNPPR